MVFPRYNRPCECDDLSLRINTHKVNHKVEEIITRTMTCANCGKPGHLYRICNEPISSFGIICVRIVQDSKGGVHPEYVMVQRKDSLSFVEFIRGKYNLQNRGYILRLLINMTQEERAHLHTMQFDELWHGFWQSDHSCGFIKEYEQSKNMFRLLQEGYLVRGCGKRRVPPTFFSLKTALSATSSQAVYTETEYGFPKGRRNINETDISCACREFSEETGLIIDDMEMCNGELSTPYEEIFIGSNHTRYRHVYYIACPKRSVQHSGAWSEPGNQPRKVLDPVQSREIKTVGWFDAESVLDRIRPENEERRDMFKHIDKVIVSILHKAHDDANANIQDILPCLPDGFGRSH